MRSAAARVPDARNSKMIASANPTQRVMAAVLEGMSAGVTHDVIVPLTLDSDIHD